MAGEILVNRKNVAYQGVLHPIVFEKPFIPNKEYFITDFRFLDELGKRANGCVFHISPGGSTRPMRITDPDYVSQRIVVKGSGLLLRIQDGEFDLLHLNAKSTENPLVKLRKGSIDCFIAGPHGMQVADVSTPPFQSTMEEQIPINDINISQAAVFWDEYRFYRGLNQFIASPVAQLLFAANMVLARVRK